MPRRKRDQGSTDHVRLVRMTVQKDGYLECEKCGDIMPISHELLKIPRTLETRLRIITNSFGWRHRFCRTAGVR